MKWSSFKAGVLLFLSLTVAPNAYALGQDTRAMIQAGTYGLVAGTVVGLAVYPLTGSSRTIFLGSSLGLYLGIVAGIYHITHRDDPENPLRGRLSDNPASEWPELEGEKLTSTSAPQTQVSLSLPVLNF